MPTELQEPVVTSIEAPPEPADSTAMGLSRGKRARPLFDPPIVRRAIVDSFVKLNPVTLAEEPGDVRGGSRRALTTVLAVPRRCSGGAPASASNSRSPLWLWFTVLFANFAEAMAEGRGKAQADTLRKTKTDASAQEAREQRQSRSRVRRPAAQRRCCASANRTT